MQDTMLKALMVNEKDNVATCLCQAEAGMKVQVKEKKGTERGFVEIVGSIPFAHKVMLSDTAKGDVIIKYGEVIGKATQDIKKGEWAHIHNIESIRARGDVHAN